MTDDFIKIESPNLGKIVANLTRFPREIGGYLGQAGDEAAKRVIFPTEGIKKYPPDSPRASQPFVTEKSRRYFFAALKSGEIEVPYRRGQSPRSERYGTQWYAERKGFATVIGNRASYAPILAGEKQSAYMAARGWRKLVDVASEKLGNITKVYNAWVSKCIKDLGL